METEVRRRGSGVREIQYLLLVAGQSAWIYPWTLAVEFWLGEKREPLLALQSQVALLAVAMVAARLAAGGSGALMERAGSSRRARRWWGVAAWLARATAVALGLLAACLVALAGLPAFRAGEPWLQVWGDLLNTGEGARALQIGVLAGILWWRGVRLGRSRPTLTVVEDEFMTGVIALASLLSLVSLAGAAAPLPGASLLLPTLVFLFSGLVGMPLAHIAEVNERLRRRGEPGPAPTGSWLVILLVVVGGLLLATLLLAQLLSFDRITALWDAVSGPGGAVLGALVYLLALPFGLLVEVLVFLARLLIPPGSPRERPRESELDLLERLRQQAEPVSLAPEVLFALKSALVIGFVAALVWMLVRALSRLGGRWQQDGVEETRDSVWSWPGAGALWRWLLARWRPLRARVAALASARHAGHGVGGGVRDLYRDFLALGASIGRARRSAETPLEYERRLNGDAPLPGRDDVRAITATYVRARYGPPTGDPPDRGSLAAALARLRALWVRHAP